MAVTWVWSGRVTDTSFRVKAKVAGATARLQYADNPNFEGAAFTSSVSASNGVASMDATGLSPNKQYYYRVEDAGTIDTSKVGRCHTIVAAGTPFSFTFATGGCAGLGSVHQAQAGALVPHRLGDHPVFDEIRAKDPLLFIHMGDFHYYNLGGGQFGIVGGGSLANYRRAYDDVLTYCPRQSELYRNQGLAYIYDDHDFGPNDSDGTYVDKDNSVAIYRERVPSYDPASTNGAGDKGIYQSFQIGRVLFIMTDGRYYRDAPSAASPRTYLGAAQKAWFKNLLTSPPAGADFIVWVSAQPTRSGSATSWGGYSEEREELYDAIVDAGWIGKFIEIAADQHQMGWDDGANTAGFPLYVLGSLDSTGGAFTSYNLGYLAGPGHFGLITINDYGNAFRVQVDGMTR